MSAARRLELLMGYHPLAANAAADINPTANRRRLLQAAPVAVKSLQINAACGVGGVIFGTLGAPVAHWRPGPR